MSLLSNPCVFRSAQVKALEKSISSSVDAFEKEKDQLVKEDARKLAEIELDSQGLRQLVKIKSKELTHMKRLASIILQVPCSHALCTQYTK